MSQTHGRSHAPRSQRRLSRTGTIAVAAVAGLVLLTGCAAGKDAQTVNQQPAIDGVSADAGTIGIRDAGVAPPATNNYPKGSNANLQLVIVNSGTADDKLVSVTSTVASSAVLGLTGPIPPADAGAAAPTASGEGSSTASARSSGANSTSASPTASASSSAAASATASAPASATPASVPIPIPANTSVQIGYSSIGPAITLVGLNTTLYPSQSVEVTFTFASGATINAPLPVKLTSGGAEAPTLQVSPSEAS